MKKCINCGETKYNSEFYNRGNIQYCRLCYQNNRETLRIQSGRETDRKYRVKHPGYENIKKRNRELRLKGLPGSYDSEQWQVLLSLCGNKCLKCGADEEHDIMTADHVGREFKRYNKSANPLQHL